MSEKTKQLKGTEEPSMLGIIDKLETDLRKRKADELLKEVWIRTQTRVR